MFKIADAFAPEFQQEVHEHAFRKLRERYSDRTPTNTTDDSNDSAAEQQSYNESNITSQNFTRLTSHSKHVYIDSNRANIVNWNPSLTHDMSRLIRITGISNMRRPPHQLKTYTLSNQVSDMHMICAGTRAVIPVYGIHAPFPYYEYEVIGVLTPSYNFSARYVSRRPRPCSKDDIFWLIQFVLQWSKDDLDKRINTLIAQGKKVASTNERLTLNLLTQELAHDANTNDDVRRMQIYQFVLTNLIQPWSDDLIPGELAKLRKLKNPTERQCAEIERAALKNHSVKTQFCSHPEIRRYFGGERYALLATYFPEHYLLGLSLVNIFILHDILVTTPWVLCFGASQYINDEMPFLHEYHGGDLPCDVRLSYESLLHVCDLLGLTLAPNDHMAVVVMHTLLKAYNDQSHGYLTYTELKSLATTLMANVKGTTAATAFSKRVSFDVIHSAVVYLANQKKIHVMNDDVHSFEDFRRLNILDDRFTKTIVFTRDSLYNSLVLVLALHKVYERFCESTNNGTEIADGNPPSPFDLDRMCSEQLAGLEFVKHNPVTNIVGDGGSGKTELARHLVNYNGTRQTIAFAFQNSHIQTLKQRVMNVRSGTIDRILCNHSKLCKCYINRLTETKSEAEQKKLRAVSNEMHNRAKLENLAMDPLTSEATALFPSEYRACPFEDITLAIVEECSTNSLEDLSLVLYVLAMCGNLRRVVTLGGLEQLPPIKMGFVHKYLVQAFGSFRMQHSHRQDSFDLVKIARAIAERDREKFIACLTSSQRIIHMPCYGRDVWIQLEQLIRNYELNQFNSQLITRTNKFRVEANERLNKLFHPPFNHRSPRVVQRSDKIIYKRTRPGGILVNNQILVVECVCFVRPYYVPPDRQGPQIGADGVTDTRNWNDIIADQEWLQVDKGSTIVQSYDQFGKTPKFMHNATETAQPLCGISHEIIKRKPIRIGDEIYLPIEPDVTKRMLAVIHDSINAHAAINKMGYIPYDSLKENPNAVEYQIEFINMHSPDPRGTAEDDGMVNNLIPVLVCTDFSSQWDGSETPTKEWLERELTARTRQFHFIPLVGTEATSFVSANALTYHNSQGREFENVIVLVPYTSDFDTNAALYTATTRGSKRIFYLATTENLLKMLMKLDAEHNSIDTILLKHMHDMFKAHLTLPNLQTAAFAERDEEVNQKAFGARSSGQKIVDLHISHMSHNDPSYTFANFSAAYLASIDDETKKKHDAFQLCDGIDFGDDGFEW